MGREKQDDGDEDNNSAGWCQPQFSMTVEGRGSATGGP
jgi:hypothetical protein